METSDLQRALARAADAVPPERSDRYRAVVDWARRRRRARRAAGSLFAAMMLLAAIATVLARSDPSTVITANTVDVSPTTGAAGTSDQLLTDRWVIAGLTPESIREEPLPIGETLEIYGIPSAIGIGLDKWVGMSISNNLSDRNVAVGFGNAGTQASFIEGGNEIGVMTWQDQTQVAFTDHQRRLVMLSSRGIAAGDLIAVAQHFANSKPAVYTLAGAEPIRELPKLVVLGPTDPRPLQINIFYAGAQWLNVLVLPRGGELLRAVRPMPSDPGAIETLFERVGWRHRTEARDWITYIDGTIVALGASSTGLDTPEMVQRLHHPTKAEWDTLRATKPPPVVGSAPINSSFYTGWRNFGLADPCDLLEAALDAVPGDGAWRFALERYAQRIERTDYADQAINLAQRTDTNARNEVDALLDARPTCTSR